MNKIVKICMIAAVVLSFTGCYNDFDDPAPAKVWTKEDFSNEKIISIKVSNNCSMMYMVVVKQVWPKRLK